MGPKSWRLFGAALLLITQLAWENATGSAALGTFEIGKIRVAKLAGSHRKREVIEANVRANLGTFFTCYQTLLERRPTAGGGWTFGFEVLADGKTIAHTVSHDQLNDLDFTSCVIKKAEKWAFTPSNSVDPTKSVSVWLPLTFKPKAPAGKSELVLWHNQEGPHAALLKDLVDAWAKKSGVVVRLETGMRMAETLLSATKLPDVVLAPSDLAAHCAELKCSTMGRTDVGISLDPSSTATVTTTAGVQGIPLFFGNQLLLFFNRQLVKKPIVDFKDLFKDGNNQSPMAMDVLSAYVFAAFTAGFSGEAVGQGDLKPTRAALLKSFGAYREMLDKKVVPSACDHLCVSADFFKGKYPYAINGDWAVLEGRRQMGDNLGLALLPTWNGTPLRSLMASHALFFPKDSWRGPKSAALKGLTAHLLSPSAQSRFRIEGWRQPVRAIAKEKDMGAGADQRAMLEQSAKLALPLMPRDGTALMWAALNHGLRLAVEGQATPEQAVDGVFAFGGLKSSGNGK